MNPQDFIMLFPALGLSSLIAIAYIYGREQGETRERKKNDVRRAHRARKLMNEQSRQSWE